MIHGMRGKGGGFASEHWSLALGRRKEMTEAVHIRASAGDRQLL